jgi:hypothetical protein
MWNSSIVASYEGLNADFVIVYYLVDYI